MVDRVTVCAREEGCGRWKRNFSPGWRQVRGAAGGRSWQLVLTDGNAH